MYGDATGTLGTAARGAGRRRHTAANNLAAQLGRTGFVLHGLNVGDEIPPIDHVVIAASGIWLIASRSVRLERVTIHRPFRGLATLRVGNRNHTELAAALDRQRIAICAALADRPDVPIQTSICFPGGQFPLLGQLLIDGHPVLPPGDLVARVASPGGLRRAEARAVAGTLAARLG